MSSAGYHSHEKVVLGIDPQVGVSASMTNVIMTDEGIVSVSSFLFRWCGLIARAYLRTLNISPNYWSTAPSSVEADRILLLRNRDQALYWTRIFNSFAISGTHGFVPFLPSNRSEVIHFEQIAWSMEFSIVAHELSQHALDHRHAEQDPKQQEFEADSLALYLCEMLDFEPFKDLHNPYLATGAGAHLTLRALEILRMADAKLGAPQADTTTHPTAGQRIDRILSRHLLQPARYRADAHWNATISRIMDAVEYVVETFLSSESVEKLMSIRNELRA